MMGSKRRVMFMLAAALVLVGAAVTVDAQPFDLEWGMSIEEVAARDWQGVVGQHVSGDLYEWETVDSLEETARQEYWAYTVEERFLNRDVYLWFRGHQDEGLLVFSVIFRDSDTGEFSPNLVPGMVERYERKYGPPSERKFEEAPIVIWETEEMHIEIQDGNFLTGKYAGVAYASLKYTEVLESNRAQDDEI